MRTIYVTNTEDFFIADSEEHAIALYREHSPDVDVELEYGEPLTASPVKKEGFTVSFEGLEDIPQHLRRFAIEKSSGVFSVTLPVEDWVKEESGYLASMNF